jgi:hypothetical protein
MNAGRNVTRIVFLACMSLPGVASAAPRAVEPVLATALSSPCAGGQVDARPQGSSGFVLRTGGYTVQFSRGNLRITRRDAGPGLRISLLAGDPSLDLLRHVTKRDITRTTSGMDVSLTATRAWGGGTITLYSYRSCPGLLRWTVSLAVRAGSVPADSTGTDISYINALGKPSQPAIAVYTGAAPSGTALSYAYDPDLNSTLFYLADLTALNGMFRATNTAAVGGSFRDPRGGPGSLVGTSADGLGFELPQGSISALTPSGRQITVLDSYLMLAAGKPAAESALDWRFLDDLGTIYAHIQRPNPQPADWQMLGMKTARDLSGADVLVSLGGRNYLKAYVSDTRRAPELITQLNVLSGVIAYEQTFGPSPTIDRVRTMLISGLSSFWAPEYRSVVNNLPIPHGPSGGSESWYYIGDLIYLARVAAVDQTARSLLMRSIGSAIALAHHVGYVFPRSISYQGWHGSGAPQADVAGGYAYLMLQAYDLTHDRHYLAEARIAIEHLAGYGFHLAYETHITALAATAAARLYRITGSRHYLELSLAPLANLFASSWIWDCGYGTCADSYHTFFGLSPLPWSGYIAMMEQAEAWRALGEYAALVGPDAPDPIRTLVAEFYRYSLSTLAYTLPPLLAKGVASASPAEYSFVPRNRLDLYIPLEDLHDGGQPSGQIGQEIYGAGGPLTLGGLSSVRLRKNLWLTAPYPMSIADHGHLIRVSFAGTPGYSITARIEGPAIHQIASIIDAGKRTVRPASCGAAICFTATGGESYMLVAR